MAVHFNPLLPLHFIDSKLLSLAPLSVNRYLAVASPIKHIMELNLKRCAAVSLLGNLATVI